MSDQQKLGKTAARHDRRTLRLASYLGTKLPPAPLQQDWAGKVKNWPMMLNDNIGDCTCAAAGHMIEQWTTYAKTAPVVPTDPEILAAYERIGGYVQGDDSTDNGCNMLDVLKAWRNSGIAGRKIEGFIGLERRNHQEVMDGVHLFGNLYIGVNLPASAQDEKVWYVPQGGPVGPGTPGSWGGHCIPIVEYDTRGLTCITWGAPLRMTWQFYDTYCDESYAVLSTDWFDNTGMSPDRFKFSELKADIARL